LINGAALNLRDMTSMTSRRLAQAGFRVTAFDRPGRGCSDRLQVESRHPAPLARIPRAAADAIGAGDGAP
jgi:pimeloyl-ACP methyl ester carboxylesterase